MAYAGVYADVEGAKADYEAVHELHVDLGLIDAYDAAVIERKDNGKVKIVKKHETPTRVGGAGGAGGNATGTGVGAYAVANNGGTGGNGASGNGGEGGAGGVAMASGDNALASGGVGGNGGNSTQAVGGNAGRGGSAFADGARMVHVLQNVPPEAWLEFTGDELKNGESGLVLARPKVSHARPQPDLYIKRIGYRFESVTSGTGATVLLEANGAKVLSLLRAEIAAGRYPTGRSIEPLAREQRIPQKALREAIDWLKSNMRVHETPMTTGGRGGARAYLRPVDAPPAS